MLIQLFIDWDNYDGVMSIYLTTNRHNIDICVTINLI